MPTYEYYCQKCKKRFSRREKISEHDARAAVCPDCASQEVERVMTSFYAKTPRKS